jgi:hypothetical protein
MAAPWMTPGIFGPLTGAMGGGIFGSQKLPTGGVAGEPTMADPQRDMKMAIASQLLAGSGWSPQRRSFGELMGNALMAGQQARMQAQQFNAQQGEAAQMAELRKAQMEQMRNKAEESPIGTLQPEHYTPESLAKFLASRNYADLVPVAAAGGAKPLLGVVNPGDYTPESLEAYEKSLDPKTGTGDYSLLRRYAAPHRGQDAPSGYRWSEGGGLEPIPGGPFDPKGPRGQTTDFSRADKLRDEYNAASKEFVTIADNYAAIQQVSKDVSAAGDLSLIFSYMKLLDPGSVVREQEFANAQNAGGVPDKVRAAWNKALRGERLSANQRADFLRQAGNVYEAKRKRHEGTVQRRYVEQAKRWNLDPSDVVGDLYQPGEGADSAAVDVQSLLDKYAPEQ